MMTNPAPFIVKGIAAVTAGTDPPYTRARNLPPLIGHRYRLMNNNEIVQELERHFASSSRDMARNHWAHSLARHHALRQALQAERRRKA